MNIKYVSFLIELWPIKKFYAVLIKEISLCLSFVKSFDVPPKQKLHQLRLSFALSF